MQVANTRFTEKQGTKLSLWRTLTTVQCDQGSLPDPGRQSVYILNLTLIIENQTFLYLFVSAHIIRNIINVHPLILLKNPDKLFIRITPHHSRECHRLIIYCRKRSSSEFHWMPPHSPNTVLSKGSTWLGFTLSFIILYTALSHTTLCCDPFRSHRLKQEQYLEGRSPRKTLALQKRVLVIHWWSSLSKLVMSQCPSLVFNGTVLLGNVFFWLKQRTDFITACT